MNIVAIPELTLCLSFMYEYFSAVVLDSTSPDAVLPYSIAVVNRINSLLQCWPSLRDLQLKAVPYPVSTHQYLYVQCYYT